MKDPTIEEMRGAVEYHGLDMGVSCADRHTETVHEMARRYLAMMEEGPVGVVCCKGELWLGDDIDNEDLDWPEGAPHRHVYAHPTTTHTEED